MLIKIDENKPKIISSKLNFLNKKHSKIQIDNKNKNKFPMLKIFIKVITIFLIFASMLSCSYNLKRRILKAEIIAKSNNLGKQIFETSNFNIYFLSKKNHSKKLNIYIEGDGFAWINPYTISNNPTPLNPIALLLAAKDNSENSILYLSRPCQYIESDCNNKYWTDSRYSIEVIESYIEIIDEYIKNNKIEEINLIGFSGGANIALILTAYFEDKKSFIEILKNQKIFFNKNLNNYQTRNTAKINFLIGVAPNIDHVKLNKIKEASPLSDSLNAIDFAEVTKFTKQLYFIGKKDKVIDLEILKNYIEKYNNAKLILIEDLGHSTKEWDKKWQEIWNEK